MTSYSFTGRSSSLDMDTTGPRTPENPLPPGTPSVSIDPVVSSLRQGLGDKLHTGRFVLYGIGPKTKVILDACPELNCRGLIDPSTTGQVIHGQPVIPLEQAFAEAPTGIIIVARANNTRIIHQRIGAEANAAGVPLFDLAGRRLSGDDTPPEDDPYWDTTIESLRARIAKATSVSFDIFDTLVTRRVSHVSDVFRLAARIAGGVDPEQFAAARIRAENELSPTASVTLEAIYDEVQSACGLTKELRSRLEDAEVEAERRVLTPRRDMVQLLVDTVANATSVTLVSDMYLSSTTLRDLLRRCGVPADLPILVSCEVGASKADGNLFLHLKDSTRHLHIGDNEEADVTSAQQNGIEPFFVRSSSDLLSRSKVSDLTQPAQSLGASIMAGLITAEAFNSPFDSGPGRGAPRIDSNWRLGYIAVGPLVTAFTSWIVSRAQTRPRRPVFFGARDGYLLQRLYEEVRSHPDATDAPPLPPSTYFSTSRVAALASSLHTEEDIRWAAQLPFSGTPEQMLQTRFGVRPNNPGSPWRQDAFQEIASAHSFQILTRAEEARGRLRRYVRTLPLAPIPDDFFVDFVAAGTIQHCLQRSLGLPLAGLYAMRLTSKDPLLQSLNAQSLYGLCDPYAEATGLSRTYTLLENALSAPHGMCSGYSTEGLPETSRGEHSRDQLSAIHSIQRGAVSFFRDFAKLHSIPTDDRGIKDIANLATEFAAREVSDLDALPGQTRPTRDHFTNRPNA